MSKNNGNGQEHRGFDRGPGASNRWVREQIEECVKVIRDNFKAGQKVSFAKLAAGAWPEWVVRRALNLMLSSREVTRKERDQYTMSGEAYLPGWLSGLFPGMKHFEAPSKRMGKAKLGGVAP